jgi:RimJ/RimL family protein N-acetyltransferase
MKIPPSDNPSIGSSMVFETRRLEIRTATPEDVELFYELWTNPQVMINVGFPRGVRTTREEIRDRLLKPVESVFEKMLVVVLRAGDQAIGECKMHPSDQDGIAETDVKLLPKYWGNRYGVEIKRGLLDYLFTHTDCNAVQATPNVNNAASIKMQEAVGGERVGEEVYQFPESMRDFTTPVHHYIYRVYRRTWQDSLKT